jgi:hypothetical protein
LKTAIAIVGNLVVIGIALISLGRYGMRPRKSYSHEVAAKSKAGSAELPAHEFEDHSWRIVLGGLLARLCYFQFG